MKVEREVGRPGYFQGFFCLKMSDARILKRVPFTQIPNQLIEDSELKPAVRFAFVFLHSKPDNWVFYRSNVAKDLGINVETLDKYLSTLEARGWLIKRQNKKPDGTFGGMIIELFFERTDGEKTPNGTDGEKNRFGKNRDRKNPDHNNTDLNNTHLKSNNEGQPQKSGSLFPESDPDKLTLFRNSLVGKFEIFEKNFKEPEFQEIDLFYYFNTVSDWSDKANKKRTTRGWLATARYFMRRDMEFGKLKRVGFQQSKTEIDSDLMDYLKM